MEPSQVAESRGKIGGRIFSETPLLVYWELTRACDLACQHCRAEAMNRRDPCELGLSEAKALIRQIRSFGDPAPHLVLTGGDPLKWPGFFKLLEYGTSLKLRLSVAPSGTYNLTRDVIRRLKFSGVNSISLSLDGSSPERHDAFRGVPGCFDWTIQATHFAHEAGLPLQVNTLVTADTLEDLPRIYRLMTELDIIRWSLFFLIPVGRGRLLGEIIPQQCEALHQWLYDLSKETPFAIKATEAPHFRRVTWLRMRAEGREIDSIWRSPVGMGFGVRDGNGIMFISHTGDVYPSGFLPLATGNVRESSPVEIYRNSELFRSIRDPRNYRGKCGRCEFNGICGGSRARAYAKTGDYLASDPLCPYQPIE
ncbi:MAG: TIGR04053 family radical SAM/SPASM domain-containing protein [Candidatus Bipolaricaulia bacterium]